MKKIECVIEVKKESLESSIENFFKKFWKKMGIGENSLNLKCLSKEIQIENVNVNFKCRPNDDTNQLIFTGEGEFSDDLNVGVSLKLKEKISKVAEELEEFRNSIEKLTIYMDGKQIRTISYSKGVEQFCGLKSVSNAYYNGLALGIAFGMFLFSLIELILEKFNISIITRLDAISSVLIVLFLLYSVYVLSDFKEKNK